MTDGQMNNYYYINVIDPTYKLLLYKQLLYKCY